METIDKISNAVEKHRRLILDAERYIWKNPETGYKEYKTSAYLAKQFEALGYKLTMAEGITGFYTVIDTGREGPEVLILGEMDSVICPSHPESDPITGAVHSCGHNAQSATLLGIAAALSEKGMLDSLCGRIRLCAVPAEELLEIEYRQKLKAEGKIKYMGGKSEFLYRGYFDGVDIAFMVHTASGYRALRGAIGCIAKTMVYKGVQSHAGGSPHKGVNALYAANCGINAANALRETFLEGDHIRFHPIITHGGDMVNAIPAKVQLESYVRGASFEAIVRENKKINRALTGAALSVGANIEIIDIPGYSPLHNDYNLTDLAKEAYETLCPDKKFEIIERINTGSTDMGDLSQIMPAIHPYCGGSQGTSHGSDYYIVDPEEACVKNAKWQLTLLYLLLGNGAQRAKKIIEEYKPPFASIREFLDFQDSLNDSGDRIDYGENEAKVRL